MKMNIIVKYIKYPKTFHLPFSLGLTDDDKSIKDCSIFENKEVVVTIKMDGENTTGYWNGYIHARSLDSKNHPSRNWVKKHLTPKLYDLPEGWRICGENLYAKHSIGYTNLKSYFLVFSIWDEKNNCLSWNDTVEWCKLLELQIVPVHFREIWNKDTEENLKEFGNKINNGLKIDGSEVEGFVVRITDAFLYDTFQQSIAKFVRQNHVKTDEHWMEQEIVKNEIL